MVPVRPGGGLISHTHDSSTPKLHPGRVLGSTAIFTAAAPGVDLRKCVSLCILQYTTVYYSILQYTTVHYITLHLQVHLSTLFFICILPPLILFSLPLSSSPPPPYPLLPPLIFFSISLSSSPFTFSPPFLLCPLLLHLNLIVLQRLAVFKEVNRKLGMLHTTNNRPFLPHTRPQHCEGTCGLKLRLQPELCVGIVVGDIDSEAAIFTQNNECSAVL